MVWRTTPPNDRDVLRGTAVLTRSLPSTFSTTLQPSQTRWPPHTTPDYGRLARPRAPPLTNLIALRCAAIDDNQFHLVDHVLVEKALQRFFQPGHRKLLGLHTGGRLASNPGSLHGRQRRVVSSHGISRSPPCRSFEAYGLTFRAPLSQKLEVMQEPVDFRQEQITGHMSDLTISRLP